MALGTALAATASVPRALGLALDHLADLVEDGEPGGPGDRLALAATALQSPGPYDDIRAARRALGLPDLGDDTNGRGATWA